MNLIVAADIHLMAVKPEFRIDDFKYEQDRKFKHILAKGVEYGADVAIAGDLFDAKDAPAWLVNRYMRLIKNFPHRVFVVFGNHDSYYHSEENEKTQLGTLIEAGVVTLLGAEPEYPESKTILYGASWGQEVPVPVNRYGTKVLIAHKTVTEAPPPPWLTGAVQGKHYLIDNPDYDFIVTGDFHEPFVVQEGNRYLINPGTMTRNKVNMDSYQPVFYLLRDGQAPMEIKIPVSTGVFASQAEIREAGGLDPELLAEFERSLKFGSEGPTFKKVVEKVVENMDDDIKNLIMEILEDAC